MHCLITIKTALNFEIFHQKLCFSVSNIFSGDVFQLWMHHRLWTQCNSETKWQWRHTTCFL